MSSGNEHYIRGVMSGDERGLGPSAMRGGLNILEPFYRAGIAVRNFKFDRKMGVKRLPIPVISFGNLTTGGTGKTPVTRALATRLRNSAMHPAILMRGYKALEKKTSDEQELLDNYLNQGRQAPIPIIANPDRYEAGMRAWKEHPDTDVFILDDGFQHRQLARDLDIVLVNATEPFGYGHVLPRGMLREPIGSLKRAHAVLITHADDVDGETMREIELNIRRANHQLTIYHCTHVLAGLRSSSIPASAKCDHPMTELRQKRFFAFTGIGDPASFHLHLGKAGGKNLVGQRWFKDHHDYTASDVSEILKEARELKAELIVTTEKDWVKVSKFQPALESNPPIWRVELELRFRDNDDALILGQILQAIEKSKRENPVSG